MFEQISLSDRLIKSDFLRSVATLAGGAALAQAIPILSSPILTRLYTPDNFGVVAVFTAIVSSFAPAVCGKYEIAMVLPRNNRQGVELLGIAMWFAFVLSSIFFLIVLFFSDSILSILKAQNLNGWIYFAPIFLFLTGLMTAMNYFANRQQDYGIMARSKMVRALAASLISIILGILGFGVFGLLFGLIVGLLFAVGYFFYVYHDYLTQSFLRLNQSKKTLFKKYKDYPLFNASSGLLNGITMAMPVFFLSYYFTGDVVGYFALVSRVVETPLSFISPSVSQVNLKTIVDLVNKGQSDSVFSYLLKLAMSLFAIAFLPALVLAIYAPDFCLIVFGDEWGTAGVFMQFLIPAFIVRFIVISISSTFGALNKNTFAFTKRMFSFVMGVIIYVFIGRTIVNPVHFIILISLHIGLTELVGIMLIISAAKSVKA